MWKNIVRSAHGGCGLSLDFRWELDFETRVWIYTIYFNFIYDYDYVELANWILFYIYMWKKRSYRESALVSLHPVTCVNFYFFIWRKRRWWSPDVGCIIFSCEIIGWGGMRMWLVSEHKCCLFYIFIWKKKNNYWQQELGIEHEFLIFCRASSYI